MKLFKQHLKRVIGDIKLTIEIFLINLVQIVGHLNLHPISSDPSDYKVLPLGYFLIVIEITSIPERSLYASKWTFSMAENNQICSKILAMWYHDYLSNLQERTN